MLKTKKGQKYFRKKENERKIIKANSLVDNVKPDEKTVFFTSYFGRSYSCSPRAIYEYMINNPEYDDYKFVWVLWGGAENVDYEKYPQLKRAKIVRQLSFEYFDYFYNAKYIISNSRLTQYLYPSKEQVYIQTWHGTPYKRIGADIEVVGANKKVKKDELIDLYSLESQKANYFISPSKFYTDKIAGAFQIKDEEKKLKIKELGYPRNDFLYQYQQSDIESIKDFFGIPRDKKIILYAPTWRDNEYQEGVGYISSYQVDFDVLQEQLSDEYVIIFKPHYFISNDFDFSKYNGFIYNGNLVADINELYIVSDMLVTDYSSVFFDYANLRRKIIFFMYDYEFYKNEVRGFYLNDEDLPGEIVKTENDLVKAIKDNKDLTYDLEKFNSIYNPYEDGNSAKRVVEEIINKK